MFIHSLIHPEQGQLLPLLQGVHVRVTLPDLMSVPCEVSASLSMVWVLHKRVLQSVLCLGSI